MNNLEIVTKEVERLERAINRKESVEKNKFNNEILQEYIELMRKEEKDVPENCPFGTYDVWIGVLDKKEKGYEKQLDNIKKNSCIAAVLKKYLIENQETEA